MHALYEMSHKATSVEISSGVFSFDKKVFVLFHVNVFAFISNFAFISKLVFAFALVMLPLPFH